MRDTALALADRAVANSTALIIYAGDAFVVAPPSFDTNNFKSNVSLLEYGVIPVDGSNATRAFALALSVLEGTDLPIPEYLYCRILAGLTPTQMLQ